MNQQLPSPNPYDVLEVSPGASNQEITRAFGMAMKKRQYSPKAIAIARKSLMNPQDRIIADYLRPIVPVVQRFKRSDFSILNTPAPKIEFIVEFDDLEEAVSQIDKVSQSDKRLGKVLFAQSPIKS